jgi:DNA repair exonuclease SbcCD ATPase subunit
MKHARSDYQNRIVDLAGKIPANEPVFLLRAKDLCALPTLHAYLTELVSKGADRDIVANVNAATLMFSKFQRDNSQLMKLPNIGTPEELPAADSPRLQQALNSIESLEEKNRGLAASLERVQGICDEYAARYSDLKILYETAVNDIKVLEIQNRDLAADHALRLDELTQVKFDLSKAVASLENEKHINGLTDQDLNNALAKIESQEKEIETLQTALKKEIDGNAV